jgi:RimJ/RimL family protein N-acetyltransferase
MREIAVEVNGARVLAREAREEDMDALVAYWHGSEPSYLESLGVDLSKLGTPEETYERLAAGLEGGEERRALIVVAERDGELVAYSNLRLLDAETACGHLHTLVSDPLVRKAVYGLFPQVIAAAAEELGISRLRFETSVSNRGINRYLQSFGLEPQTKYLEQPDGMARPGEFNVYEISL